MLQEMLVSTPERADGIRRFLSLNVRKTRCPLMRPSTYNTEGISIAAKSLIILSVFREMGPPNRVRVRLKGVLALAALSSVPRPETNLACSAFLRIAAAYGRHAFGSSLASLLPIACIGIDFLTATKWHAVAFLAVCCAAPNLLVKPNDTFDKTDVRLP